MNLHITDKYSLVDLITKGSQARRYVKPEVLISNAENGIFEKGDIIDANATLRLINDTIYGENKRPIGHYSTLADFQQALSKNEIEPDTVYFIEDTIQIYINGKYTNIGELLQSAENGIQSLQSQINELTSSIEEDGRATEGDIQSLQSQIDELKTNPVGPKHIILTQQQYDNLETYEHNALYFIVESVYSWTFGNNFPVEFNSIQQ